MTFRLQSFRPKERDLQAQIVDYLEHEKVRDRIVWFCRVNGGAFRVGKRYIRCYLLWLGYYSAINEGYADLHGMLPGGRYFALEVKRPNESLTVTQDRFLDTVKANGGIAAVVRSFEDAQTALFGESDPHKEGVQP